MFGRATITLGISPHSSFVYVLVCVLHANNKYIAYCRRWMSHGGNMESNMHTDMTMSIETIPSVSSGIDSSPSNEDPVYHDNRYP